MAGGMVGRLREALGLGASPCRAGQRCSSWRPGCVGRPWVVTQGDRGAAGARGQESRGAAPKLPQTTRNAGLVRSQSDQTQGCTQGGPSGRLNGPLCWPPRRRPLARAMCCMPSNRQAPPWLLFATWSLVMVSSGTVPALPACQGRAVHSSAAYLPRRNMRCGARPASLTAST